MDEATYRRYGDLRFGTHFKYKGKDWVKLSRRYRELGNNPNLGNKLMAKKTLIRFEMAPTNSMGMSSTVHGTGAIDTFDPIMQRRNKLRSFSSVTRRKKPTT